ncbi:unnamed protein product [Caenorhabditis angaria]|uniref:Ubiquitin-like domain-containing protein n=1 Tax=Caenorhabditis angaria TaxID=860376 RepID=A0A9P1IWX2_9PELO|nr:unnamed protein product [Caenorhabditis angaria]
MDFGQEEEHVESEKIRPFGCACDRCEIELVWNLKKIRVTSPQVSAGIHRATRKSMRMEEFQLTSDKVAAIKDFHECPNLLNYLEQFPSWLKAIQNVREELELAYENAKMIHFSIKNWEGRKGELEKPPETTFGELKLWMKDYFGRKSWVDSKTFIIGRTTVEDHQTLGELKVKNGDCLRCM